MTRWNVILTAASLFCLVYVGSLERYGYAHQAEAMAEDLAPRLAIDRRALQDQLRAVLADGAPRRAYVMAAPLLILVALHEARLVAPLRRPQEKYENP